MQFHLLDNHFKDETKIPKNFWKQTNKKNEWCRKVNGPHQNMGETRQYFKNGGKKLKKKNDEKKLKTISYCCSLHHN